MLHFDIIFFSTRPFTVPLSEMYIQQEFLDHDKYCDVDGNALPRLVYVSREKRPGFDHHKKAGAMNALVSA